jgi:hypothetical protein
MTLDEQPGERRLLTLEAAVLDLTRNVRKLVDALQVVGALTSEQHEQAARQSSIELQAAEAQALSLARYRRTTMMQRITGLVIVIVVPLVSLIAYWSLTNQVNQQFIQEQNGRTAACQLRNQTNVFIPEAQDRALALAFASNPPVARIHLRAADALAKAVVDCSIYKRAAK